MSKKILLVSLFTLTSTLAIPFTSAQASETVNNSEGSVVQPYCLTCGGTYTEGYKVIDTTISYGSWKIARPIVGGVHGGNVSLTDSISYTTSLSSSTGVNIGAVNTATGYTIGKTETKSFTQTFNTVKNEKYYLMSRPIYTTKKVRYSTYTYTTGGRKESLGDGYTNAKKLTGTQLDLVLQ